MVMGKPSQAIQVEHGAKELAVELIKALREAVKEARMNVPPEPLRLEGGNVRILGKVVEAEKDNDFPC